jgi:hypothetical protein
MSSEHGKAVLRTLVRTISAYGRHAMRPLPRTKSHSEHARCFLCATLSVSEQPSNLERQSSGADLPIISPRPCLPVPAGEFEIRKDDRSFLLTEKKPPTARRKTQIGLPRVMTDAYSVYSIARAVQ